LCLVVFGADGNGLVLIVFRYVDHAFFSRFAVQFGFFLALRVLLRVCSIDEIDRGGGVDSVTAS